MADTTQQSDPGFDRLEKALNAQTKQFTATVTDLGGQIRTEHNLEGKVDHLQAEVNQIKLSISENQNASNEKYHELDTKITEMSGALTNSITKLAGEVTAAKQVSDTNKKILIYLFCTVGALGLSGLVAIATFTGGG